MEPSTTSVTVMVPAGSRLFSEKSVCKDASCLHPCRLVNKCGITTERRHGVPVEPRVRDVKKMSTGQRSKRFLHMHIADSINDDDKSNPRTR